MQIHEQNTFKFDPPPFTMSFEDHAQDLTPSYIEPIIIRDNTPIPKKNFFRQILDLPKDVQEMRVTQRMLQEDIKEANRDISAVENRVDNTEKQVSRFQDKLDSLSRQSTTYQGRMDSLSSSIDPLAGQIAELKLKSLQVGILETGLQKTKMIIGVLAVMNVILLCLYLWPIVMGK